MARKNVVLASIVCVFAMMVFSSVLASGGVVASRTVSASGVISTVNLGLYSDVACTRGLTSIDWGAISPGGSVVRMIYVRNTGGVPLTLSMSKTNWIPSSASAMMTLVWDKEGVLLAGGQVAAATLTLKVSESISGISTFDVDIVVSGTA